jgi:hypothetical protein
VKSFEESWAFADDLDRPSDPTQMAFPAGYDVILAAHALRKEFSLGRSSVLLREKDASVFHLHRIGLYAGRNLSRRFDLPSMQTNLPVMERAYDRIAGQNAITQWTTAMGALVIYSEHPFTKVEEGNLLSIDGNASAFSQWDIPLFCDVEPFIRFCHRTTSSAIWI